MKKNITIISSIIALIAIIVSLGITVFNERDNLEKKGIDNVFDVLNYVEKYFNKYDYINSGEVSVSAKYKGAHGENFPKDFKYNFLLDNTSITFENNEGYFTKQFDQRMIRMIEVLNKIKTDELSNLIKINGREYKNNKIYLILDKDNINKILNTQFKNTYLIINTKGFIKKSIDDIVLELDDIKFTLESDQLNVKYDNTNLKIDFNSKGYSLNVNNKIKMNVFFEDEKNRYSIVINQVVFYVETFQDKVIFKTTTQSAIYNGLDLIFNFSEQKLKKNKITLEESIPVFRYFNNLKWGE